MKKGQKDIKPLLKWAFNEGEAKIIDRVLLKLMPQILESKLVITQKDIQDAENFFVSQSLYNDFEEVTQQIVGKKFKQGESNV